MNRNEAQEAKIASSVLIYAILFALVITSLGLSIISLNKESAYVPQDTNTEQAEEFNLTPKSQLKTIEAKEGKHWTHAPNVPAAIDRDEQVRLVVKWEATEVEDYLDEANGVKYNFWGFEGSTPGPLLRVRQGDLIEFHLTNNLDSKNPHNIDFHFVTGPGGGAKATTVAPGETTVVEVRATTPGLFMYHCATPDIPTHIANGMYGGVLVEPSEGMDEVDTELYVVQSEFYTDSKEAGLRTIDTKQLDSENPNYVVFNGSVGSMLGDNTPEAEVGDDVRVYFVNAGPNLISSFHIIGEIFDKVYREGDLITPPAEGVQTTLVPAGGATVAEFTFDVPGAYILVDHAISRALHKGAVGVIAVGGEENPEIFENKNTQKDAGNPSEHTPDGDGTTVVIPDSAWNPNHEDPEKFYAPNEITVEAGTTVTWVNKDSVQHTVDLPGTFESGMLDSGESFSYTFDEPGVYEYHCHPHPWMTGKVIVLSKDGSTPDASEDDDGHKHDHGDGNHNDSDESGHEDDGHDDGNDSKNEHEEDDSSDDDNDDDDDDGHNDDGHSH